MLAAAGRIRMIERVAASGSCARCGRALDLASTYVGGRWYCSGDCALGGDGQVEPDRSLRDEVRLYPRPRRFMRRRRPKELNRAS
jgi:hypothetical protein